RLEDASQTDLEYQAHILPGVSRTFALTIPVLPERLAVVMTNAYLLCRLADTIEDDPGLDNAQKSHFHERFVDVVASGRGAEAFAADLAPHLSSRTLPAEKDLVENTAAIIRITHSFSTEERAALTRCIRIMCAGMPEFQRSSSRRGLADLQELGSYCYYVAGVVGEMCTQLFLLHCRDLERSEERRVGKAVGNRDGAP